MAVHVHFYTKDMQKMNISSPDISIYQELLLRVENVNLGSVFIYKSVMDIVLGIIAFKEIWSSNMEVDFKYIINIIADVLKLENKTISVHLPTSNNKFITRTKRSNVNAYYEQFKFGKKYNLIFE